MITRQHKTLTGETGAVFSACERYRFRLWRKWGDGPTANFVMLNPSTADDLDNDPTVERCRARAARAGYGMLIVTNLFAWRATDPKELLAVAAPIQPANMLDNDLAILEAAAESKIVVCGWGNHGTLLGRSQTVLKMLRRQFPDKLHCLAITGKGEPGHPLYLSYNLQPVFFK
jgi:hypothetical protein